MMAEITQSAPTASSRNRREGADRGATDNGVSAAGLTEPELAVASRGRANSSASVTRPAINSWICSGQGAEALDTLDGGRLCPRARLKTGREVGFCLFSGVEHLIGAHVAVLGGFDQSLRGGGGEEQQQGQQCPVHGHGCTPGSTSCQAITRGIVGDTGR